MDPAKRFLKTHKPRFRALAEDCLTRAAKAARIDLRENAACVKAIRRIEHALARARSGRGWRIAFTVLLLLAGTVITLLLAGEDFPETPTRCLAGYWILTLLLIACKLIPDLFRLNRTLDDLTAKHSELVSATRAKLAPFYSQFTWKTLPGLIERTLPEIRFDDFLSANRINDLRERFGFDFAELMQHKSMLFTHSGTFFGYPFIFYNARRFHWGKETYTGTKFITWTTRERGPDGKPRTRFHSETLVASVTKPCPRFDEEKRLLFAHPAAPNLSFSREPSGLAGKTGFWAGVKRRRQLRKLKRFESILDDESNYTLVANEAFEVLFNTMNRDHEVEFRVLFTPRAQQQMVSLLSDTAIGYGDDITYLKRGPLTLLSPEHLNSLPFSNEPLPLPCYDFKELLRILLSRYEEFFRSLYFALAPLYTIPAYQQPPQSDPPASGGISTWEMEALANRHGPDRHDHPAAVTDHLYRVSRVDCAPDGSPRADVLAISFRGTEHIEHIPVRGGDGRTHLVSVPWINYTEIRRKTAITDLTGWRIPQRTATEHRG